MAGGGLRVAGRWARTGCKHNAFATIRPSVTQAHPQTLHAQITTKAACKLNSAMLHVASTRFEQVFQVF